MSEEKKQEELKVFKQGLESCQDAIAVLSSVPLQVEKQGREVRAYQWLKEVEYNLKSAVVKLETPEPPQAA